MVSYGIGPKLKELRFKRNMTQRELSEASGVNSNHISQIECEQPYAVNLTARTIYRLAKALNVKAETLLGEMQDKAPRKLAKKEITSDIIAEALRKYFAEQR